MALRDVFDSSGCGPGAQNALSNFFNGRMADREKVREQDRWAAEFQQQDEDFERQMGMGGSNRRTEDALAVREFLRGADPESSSMFSGFGGFEQQFEEQDERMSRVEGLLHEGARQQMGHVLHDFLRASISGAVMPLAEIPALGLSVNEKEKIQTRTKVLMRQLAKDAPQQYIDRQLVNLYSSLRLDEPGEQVIDDDEQFLEKSWNSARDQTRLQRQRADEWASEFQNFREPQYAPEDFRDLERTYQRVNPQIGWLDEYQRFEEPKFSEADFADLEPAYKEAQEQTQREKQGFTSEEMKERYEEELWFSQFLTNGGSTIGNQTTKEWLQEYDQFKEGQQQQRGRQEGEVEEPGQSWVDEFTSFSATQTQANDEDDLRDIAGRFESITDPKLRNSNFMKFVGKINKGKVRFVDNQVVDTDT